MERLLLGSRTFVEWFKLLAFELYTKMPELLILEEFELKSEINDNSDY